MDGLVIVVVFVMGFYSGHRSSGAAALRRRLSRIRDSVTDYGVSRESLREDAQRALDTERPQ